jgi:hypothetical protein
MIEAPIRFESTHLLLLLENDSVVAVYRANAVREAVRHLVAICRDHAISHVRLKIAETVLVDRPPGTTRPEVTQAGLAHGFGEAGTDVAHRVTLRMPPVLADAVDRTAGRRNRTTFINEAVREKLAREAANRNG